MVCGARKNREILREGLTPSIGPMKIAFTVVLGVTHGLTPRRWPATHPKQPLFGTRKVLLSPAKKFAPDPYQSQQVFS